MKIYLATAVYSLGSKRFVFYSRCNSIFFVLFLLLLCFLCFSFIFIIFVNLLLDQLNNPNSHYHTYSFSTYFHFSLHKLTDGCICIFFLSLYFSRWRSLDAYSHNENLYMTMNGWIIILTLGQRFFCTANWNRRIRHIAVNYNAISRWHRRSWLNIKIFLIFWEFFYFLNAHKIN